MQYQDTKGVSDSCPLPIVLEYTHTHTHLVTNCLERPVTYLTKYRGIQIQSHPKAFQLVRIQSKEKLIVTMTPIQTLRRPRSHKSLTSNQFCKKHRMYDAVESNIHCMLHLNIPCCGFDH